MIASGRGIRHHGDEAAPEEGRYCHVQLDRQGLKKENYVARVQALITQERGRLPGALVEFRKCAHATIIALSLDERRDVGAAFSLLREEAGDVHGLGRGDWGDREDYRAWPKRV